MTMTAEQLAQLRERYQEQIAPKCHICGAEMTIQRAGGGSLVYGCTGRVDSDGDGYVFAEGRDFADNHYARSRVTVANNSDPDVLALLDELERKDALIAEMTDERTASMTELSRIIRQEMNARRAAEKRIAELEARTVTVKLPDVERWRSVDAVRAQNAYRVLVIKTLADAGINLTVEG